MTSAPPAPLETGVVSTRRGRPPAPSHFRPRRIAGVAALYGILAILILMPVALVVISAFTTTTPRPGNIDLTSLTLENFAAVFSPGALRAAGNSLLVGIGASIVALACGGFLAFVTARSNAPARRFLYFVGLVPMFLPSFVGALAWGLLGGPNAGLLNILARDLGLGQVINIYTLPGLIVVLGIYYAPYAFLLIHASFSLMNPDLEEAARVHGSTPAQVLRRVTFPLATPAILGSAILIFVLTVENFPVAQMIGSASGLDTLPTYIFRLMNSAPSRGNEAAAVAIALVIVVLVVTAIQRRIVSRRTFTTVAGKGLKLAKVDLGWFRVPALILGIVYFVVTTVLPLLALLFVAMHESPYVASVTGAFTSGRLNLDEFVDVLTDPTVQRATVNSVTVGVSAALIGTVLAFIVSYVVNRTKTPGRGGLGYISMIPLAVPAIVLGLGLLWTWLLIPLPVYGTLLVMVIAFVAAQMPQGYQGASSGILQIHADLEDSAVMHGASRTRAIWKVTAPLLRVPLTSTFLLLLMLSMRELTVPLFLFTTDTRLLSIIIFDDFENGILQSSAATSVLYCGLIFVLAYLARRFGADAPKGN
ncbi:ABC transporter permease [Microbacterium sp. TNHR37B]|uniref:ABC transporter permease n=1 Tax=Microbacterium sp. TNHR37B TaxID=1775956 RepID=UPI0007B1A098|nr:iron ABC transporter permease [Microbacterium sp. TNHR37B]KZE89975.1 Trehalose transport system permease protein SugB [Microbacterium sp. TNHR37B]